MHDKSCGICRLLETYARGEIVPEIIYESEQWLAVHSTKPFAETHVFIAAKPHIPTVFGLGASDNDLVLDMMKAVTAAAKEVIALRGACKLEMYLGEFQNTKHLHCHVIYDKSID